MNPGTIYRRTPDAVAADLGDGKLAIMGLARGRYYALNPVGRVIWDFLDVPRAHPDIRAQVLAQFEVDATTCERDMDRFLQDLLREGLVEVVSK
jgi:hypothetical protein